MLTVLGPYPSTRGEYHPARINAGEVCLQRGGIAFAAERPSDPMLRTSITRPQFGHILFWNTVSDGQGDVAYTFISKGVVQRDLIIRFHFLGRSHGII